MNTIIVLFILIWLASFDETYTYYLSSVIKSQRKRALMLLSEDSYDKIESVRTKYKSLSSKNDDSYNIKELKVIIDSADALISIEKDLLMFQEHLNGDDDKLKETAEIFTREFQDCKKNIEEQLSVLLNGLNL